MTEDGAPQIVVGKPKLGKKRIQKRILVGVLSALLVVIVGLIVAIVVVNLNSGKTEVGEGGGNGSGEVVEDVDPNQIVLDGIREEIGTMSGVDAEMYLDEKIEEYQGTELDYDVKLIKVYYFYNAGQFACALNLLQQIDKESLSQYELMEYYAAMRDVYRGLEDTQNSAYYQDLYLAVYLEIFDGGAGGD